MTQTPRRIEGEPSCDYGSAPPKRPGGASHGRDGWMDREWAPGMKAVAGDGREGVYVRWSRHLCSMYVRT